MVIRAWIVMKSVVAINESYEEKYGMLNLSIQNKKINEIKSYINYKNKFLTYVHTIENAVVDSVNTLNIIISLIKANRYLNKGYNNSIYILNYFKLI